MCFSVVPEIRKSAGTCLKIKRYFVTVLNKIKQEFPATVFHSVHHTGHAPWHMPVLPALRGDGRNRSLGIQGLLPIFKRIWTIL